MSSPATRWSPNTICLRPPMVKGTPLERSPLATAMYERTCRTHFGWPGFCVVNVGARLESRAFRQLMVDLKREMAAIHEDRTGNTLIYLSAARFDQQETTKLHRDGGPEECFLMLGYEPSRVPSQLRVSDYARCALDLKLSAQEFLARYNPMFQAGEDKLRRYTTGLPCFSRNDFQIICINNSSAPYSELKPAWQGMLHTAKIFQPDKSERRIVNSTMVAPVPAGTADVVGAEELQEFVTTTAVRRRGYDKPVSGG